MTFWIKNRLFSLDLSLFFYVIKQMQIHFYAQVIILQALMYITFLFYSNAQQRGGGQWG